MKETFDEGVEWAYRRRIQLQALYHCIGKSVPCHVVMKFRNAGTWDASIDQPTPQNVFPILTQPNHPQRLPLPDGPLIVVLEDNKREVLDVVDLLLSQEPKIRSAALEHFLNAQSNDECWISPYVLDLLKKNAEVMGADHESEWINAGLILRDAINRDFRVNCAGARQATKLKFDESYQEYLGKVLRPSAHFFDHDRPPICSPAEERDKILAKFDEWSSLDLGLALDRYLAFCGYLPLADELSAGSLVAIWAKRHADHDIWSELWKWTHSCPSVLARYHAAHALLEHPQWIQLDEINKLIDVIRCVISSSGTEPSHTEAPFWELRAYLLQHYQFHLESSFPGVKSDVVSVAACWLSDLVAKLLHSEAEHVKRGCQFLLQDVLPLSWRRWSMARSPITQSSLQIASHYNPFIWGDSLLATAVRKFTYFPECRARDEYRSFLLTWLTSSLCAGSLRLTKSDSNALSFELPITPSDIGIPDAPVENEIEEGARQVIAVRREIETTSEIKTHLAKLREMPSELCGFLLMNLRCLRGDQGGINKAFQGLLNDDEWRGTVFQRLSADTIGTLISVLIDWQLHQNEEWLIRVPHLFAIECENAADPDREELLLSATTVSAMAADVSSPVVRLLMGTKQTQIATKFEAWRHMTREIARESEPWLAARVRGFLGTIESIA